MVPFIANSTCRQICAPGDLQEGRSFVSCWTSCRPLYWTGHIMAQNMTRCKQWPYQAVTKPTDGLAMKRDAAKGESEGLNLMLITLPFNHTIQRSDTTPQNKTPCVFTTGAS
eukprot:2786300-Amphidinium_carterae.1